MHIEAVRGDITAQRVDVIVNAANSGLLGGGGVDGAIHLAAGRSLLDECRHVRASLWPQGLPVGDAVATGAGRLPAQWVVHTVGPRYDDLGAAGAPLLASCHRRSLEVAEDLGAHSVAFPAISCGVYGWSAEEAAPIAIGAVRDYAAAHPQTAIELVRFVLFNEAALSAFTSALSR